MWSFLKFFAVLCILPFLCLPIVFWSYSSFFGHLLVIFCIFWPFKTHVFLPYSTYFDRLMAIFTYLALGRIFKKLSFHTMLKIYIKTSHTTITLMIDQWYILKNYKVNRDYYLWYWKIDTHTHTYIYILHK